MNLGDWTAWSCILAVACVWPLVEILGRVW